jgi:hypothetical protein
MHWDIARVNLEKLTLKSRLIVNSGVGQAKIHSATNITVERKIYKWQKLK